MTSTAALMPLARAAEAQLASFGSFARGDDAGTLMDTVLPPRLTVWMRLFQVIDTVGPQGQAAPDSPLIYNTAQWPAGLAPAGHASTTNQVGLAPLATSRFMLWNLQREPDSHSPTALKLLRAALWVVREQGVHAALRYLLDLLKAGHLLDATPAFMAMDRLLDVRRRVADDADIVRVMVAQPEGDATTWIRAELLPVDVDTLPVLRELTDDLEVLLDEAEREIDAMVLARGLDAWVLGQLMVKDILDITRSLFMKHELWENLAFVARTTRIEEIRADTGAFTRILSAYRGGFADEGFRYGPHFSIFRGMLKIVRANAGPDDWKERLLSERAMVPAQLQSAFLKDDDIVQPRSQDLPDAWRKTSAALAPMLAECQFRDPRLALSRPTPFDPAAIDPQDVQAFLDERGIDKPDARSALIDLVCDRSHPIGGRPSDEVLLAAGIAKDDKESLVAGLEAALALAEIRRTLGRVDEARHRGERGLILPLWQATCETYPYFDHALYEYAIALDEAGRSSEALSVLERAILLQPSEPMRWQSLGVVLRRLGHPDEAAIARFMAENLAN